MNGAGRKMLLLTCSAVLYSAALAQAQVRNAIELEQLVLSKIHQTNQMEVSLGHLAEEKATRSGVRAYGDRLWRDHHIADLKVKALARAEGVELIQPKPQTKQERQFQQSQMKIVDKLKAVQGPEFDQIYLNAMVQGHTHAIDTLDDVAGRLNDENVRSLVEKLIPILKQHRELARHLEAPQKAASALR